MHDLIAAMIALLAVCATFLAFHIIIPHLVSSYRNRKEAEQAVDFVNQMLNEKNTSNDTRTI